MMALWARCWWELVVAAVAIRSPWRWRYLNPALASERRASADLERIWRALWSASLWHCKRITCLEYSAALNRLLKRRGFDCRLQIGVREPEESRPLAAHAWVELPDGKPLGMTDEWTDYLPLKTRRWR